MFFHVAQALTPTVHAFNVVHYVSFRAMAALLTALLFSFGFGTWFIGHSQQFFRAKARDLTPENHRAKDDMPTMGGIFILMTTIATALLWVNVCKAQVWIFLLGLVAFGAIGFWDDWCKIRYRIGISARTKFLAQIGAAVGVALLWQWTSERSAYISFPFFKNFNPELGVLIIPWAVLVIVGCSNAVNLTDGLDGLAIGSLISNFATFSIISYLAGHSKLAQYLNIPFTDTAEITVLGAALVGSSLGFLWYNTYPAQIFMGDVGSLALGAGLALMALFSKQEMLLLIAGGLFAVEALSVMLQVWSFRYRGKRIFKMAPIHHHFELLGWQESKITVRFGIISLILCLLALMTLKMR